MTESQNQQTNSGRRKRQTKESAQCEETVRIAGTVTTDTNHFKVGDGKTYGSFYNCPLVLEETYVLGVLAVTDLLGDRAVTWQPLKEPVTVTTSIAITIPIVSGLLCLVVLIAALVVLTLCLLKRRKKRRIIRVQFSRGENVQFPQLGMSPPDQRERDPIASDEHVNDVLDEIRPEVQRPDEPNEPIYEEINEILPEAQRPDELNEHIYEEVDEIRAEAQRPDAPSEHIYDDPDDLIYDDIAQCVPRYELEAFFNRIINSLGIIKGINNVCSYNSESFMGEYPRNRMKNRSMDVLPFDDTRVKIGITDGDCTSDYINANHVKGYGNRLHYIAAQGPKDENVSTIVDFWRMVVENNVTAIFMIANFLEDGKRVVGQYINQKGTLIFGRYTIAIVNTKQYSCFAISKVQVLIKGDAVHDVTHFQYTNWPENRLPLEAISVADMVRHFRNQHTEGGVVVHCSLGTHRTGTMLLVLLLQDMLLAEDGLDPQEVLTGLRKSRVRMVEDTFQYNFALQVMDEILFGRITNASVSDLQNNLEVLLEQSQLEYRKIISLPSSLTYKTSSNPKYQRFNRCPNILPADSHHVRLQMVDDVIESTYINAIRVPSLLHKEALIVTEHPIPATVEKFWRLVGEKRCSLIIFIQNFSGQSREEFPLLMTGKGNRWKIEGITVYIRRVEPYQESFTKYSVTIIDKAGQSFDCDVYEVLHWNFGCNLPASSNVLVTLGELLSKSPPSTDNGPALLSCGNGVTGCGMVAACRLLWEQMEAQQEVDIYRTIVKLRRCRKNFIASKEQFSMLYEVAAKYAKSFSNYVVL